MLCTWPLEATTFNGDSTAGPVPTLFAEDVEGASEAINSNPARAHADIQRLARVFYMPEILTPTEATQLVKKPR